MTANMASAEIVGLERIATGFASSVFVTHAPGDPDRMFVVEQAGRIRVFDRTTGAVSPDVFLDIESLVDDGGNEQGLLGLAFHPDYQENGYFYVNYTHDPGPGLDRTRVDRFTVAEPATSTTVDALTRLNLLEFEQPFSNHNGGWLGFSPADAYLYVSTGDGGDGNDPQNNGQRLNTLLGKMLRIDVNNQDAGLNYAVPDDNPFVGQEEALPEIWSYGLRNPWRASFDRATGDLWIGDVGQGAREEIDFQSASSEGGDNYGWRLREGDIQTPSVGGSPPADYVPPVYDYPSDGAGLFGGNSVVGGYVYRGPDPEVNGRYFFGDSFPSQLWTFEPVRPGFPDGPDATVANVEGIFTPDVGSVTTPVAFGEDPYGNLYIVDRFNGIFRIVTDAFLPGDYDGDGDVDDDDYLEWKNAFGTNAALPDGNGDGVVDAADYTVWRNNFGASVHNLGAGGGSVSVPEPAAIVLLGSALALFLLCRQRHGGV
jgi:glucose/arabinose dehydrogenase